MAYNNGFPINYQPVTYLPQVQQQIPMQQQTQSQPNQQSNILWVQGEAGAKAWPVANGSSVQLMDSEDSYFYIKSADQYGMPSTKKFKYEEVIDDKQETPKIATPNTSPEYVTKEELEQRLFNFMTDVNSKLDEVKEEINNGKQPIQNSKRR